MLNFNFLRQLLSTKNFSNENKPCDTKILYLVLFSGISIQKIVISLRISRC